MYIPLILRELTDPNYSTKGSELTFDELDYNFKYIGDAINGLSIQDTSSFADYDPSKTYSGGQSYFVAYSGNVYEFVSPSDQTGITPGTNSAVWELSSAGVFSHQQNTDTYLAFGTPDQVSAHDLRVLLDTPPVLTDYIRLDGTSSPTTGNIIAGNDFGINWSSGSGFYDSSGLFNIIANTSMTFYSGSNQYEFYNPSNGSVTEFVFSSTVSRTLAVPDKSGTIALISDIDSANIISGLGYTPENAANKATDFSTINNTLYPTIQAVSNYVGQTLDGVSWKTHCVAATTANITLSGTQTIDGYAAQIGDRILVKNQSSATDNGIYIVSSGAWSRSADMSTGAEFPSAAMYIDQGTTNVGSRWVCSNATAPTIGTTAITFVQVSNGISYTNGAGIALAGNVFSLDNTYFTGDVTLSGGVGTVGAIHGKPITLATGFLKYNGTSFVFDNSTYITANQTITLSGDISGSGSTSITVSIGAGKVTNTMLAGSITASNLIGTDIAAVGTIGTGVWNGTAIADTYISSAATWNAKVSSQWITISGTDIYYSAGNVRIGDASDPTTTFNVVNTNTTSLRGAALYQYSNSSNSSQLNLLKYRGTVAAPTVIVTADVVSNLSSWAYDGTNPINVGSIRVTSTGTIATGIIPTVMDFRTMNSSGVLTTGFTIDQNQNATHAGTVAISSFTNGGVVVNTGGVLAQDANNFYFASALLSVKTGGDFTGTDAINIYKQIDSYTANNSDNGMSISHSRGTGTSPTESLANDYIGPVAFYPYNGSAWVEGASMRGYVEGTTTNNRGARLEFWTKANGGSLAKGMYIDSTQTVYHVNTTQAPSYIANGVASGLYGYLQVTPQTTIPSAVNGSLIITSDSSNRLMLIKRNIANSADINRILIFPDANTTITFPTPASGGADTVAYLGTAQTFTQTNTFSATQDINSIAILNSGSSSYYNAISSSSSGQLNLGANSTWTSISIGNGFGTFGIGSLTLPGSISLSSTTLGKINSASSTTSTTAAKLFLISGANTSTGNSESVYIDVGNSSAGSVGGLVLFNSSTTPTWNGLQRGVFVSQATANATGDPTGGFFLWSDSSGYARYREPSLGVNDYLLHGTSGASAPSTTALTAFTSYYGTGGTVGLSTPNSWASVKIGGTVYKIPLYT